jgi:hypothetical protein
VLHVKPPVPFDIVIAFVLLFFNETRMMTLQQWQAERKEGVERILQSVGRMMKNRQSCNFSPQPHRAQQKISEYHPHSISKPTGISIVDLVANT